MFDLVLRAGEDRAAGGDGSESEEEGEDSGDESSDESHDAEFTAAASGRPPTPSCRLSRHGVWYLRGQSKYFKSPCKNCMRNVGTEYFRGTASHCISITVSGYAVLWPCCMSHCVPH